MMVCYSLFFILFILQNPKLMTEHNSLLQPLDVMRSNVRRFTNTLNTKVGIRNFIGDRQTIVNRNMSVKLTDVSSYYMWCLSIYFLNNSQRIHSSSLICGAFIQVNFIIFSLINYFIKLMLSCTIPSFKHTCTNCMIYDLNSILRALIVSNHGFWFQDVFANSWIFSTCFTRFSWIIHE